MAAPVITTLPQTKVRVSGLSGPQTVIVATMVCDGTVGALPNDIPASLFGVPFIEKCGPAVKNDNTLIVLCAPAFNGASLLGKAAASAAPANIPAGAYSIVVYGP